jgi:iron complex transport system ATP-binding protein
MAFLKVKEACFGYNSQNILKDISFKMDKGQIFCLIGPNGSGKTTLLDCIMGILSLKSGKIFLQDQDISQLSPKKIAQKIAYVPQIHNKTFPYTVEEIVLMGRAAYNGMFNSPGYHDHQITHNAIKIVGIKHLKDRPYTELSGGEGQLVMIARALAQQASLMIMDEPTTHLDFQNSLIVLETIKRLVKERQLSVLLATHRLNHAFYFENNGLDTIAAMLNHQNFAVFGRPKEVLSTKNIGKVFNIDCQIIDYHLDQFYNQKYIIPVKTID